MAAKSPQPQDPEYLTMGHAQVVLGKSPSHARRFVLSGRLPSILTANGIRIVKRQDVLALKAELATVKRGRRKRTVTTAR